MRALLKIHRITGDAKYLEPIPRALGYPKKCRLPDGRMARYHELQTNRPRSMNRKDGNRFLPSLTPICRAHYGWKQSTEVEALARRFATVQPGKPKAAIGRRKLRRASGGQPRFAIAFRYLDSGAFDRNVELLSDYLNATRAL